MDAKELYDFILADSVDTKQQGTRWERAVKRYLENDPAWSARIDKVWVIGQKVCPLQRCRRRSAPLFRPFKSPRWI